MAFDSIQEVFNAFTKLKVLVIGDSMIDTYIHGVVNRISPEAPVPIVNVLKETNSLGGAANVALNLTSLGADVILCTVCGRDAAGDDLIALMSHHALSAEGLLRSDRPTTIKKRIMSGSNYLIRVDHENDELLPEDESLDFTDLILTKLDQVDLVIFEDYDKGAIGLQLIEKVTAAARAKNIPVAVDPKFRNFNDYKGVSLFKPNLAEFNRGTQSHTGGVLERAKYLRDKLHFDHLLLTQSSQGVFYYSESDSGTISAQIREVSDVSGAGDTVIAIAGLTLALGLPIRFISELANLGGGIVCEYPGVIPVSKDRLLSEAGSTLTLPTFK